MAVIENKYQATEGGLRKGIDAESIPLALDILQRGLYAFPIQSTVRELASNAYDAIKERDVAKKILSGETSIEDHYDVTKVDGIYHSSAFDPSYFDLNWLSDDPNVHIYYEEGVQKDLLRIVDNGVGLGGERLVGYFKLNFSTKRSNKDSLGKWGLGSKVALSLNVDFFTVTTRYNGKKYSFEVYLDKVDPITPRFSHGKENHKIQLTDTCSAYYEETTEKNGLEVQVEIKKHNKKSLFEALESQLMYMPSIRVHHKALNSLTYEDKNIAAKVLYRDEDIIISESTVYDRPHVLLGTGEALISYGLVHFNELELEPKRGSVGLILDINDIEVTPPREAPIWSPKTREAILNKYNKVTETATKMVNQHLAASPDYLSWLRNISSVLGSLTNGSNSVIGRLSSIIDISAIKDLSFPLDKTIKYHSDFITMVGNEINLRVIEYSRYGKKVNRTRIKSIGALNKPVYYSEKSANPFTDRYLYEENGEFVLIQPRDNVDPKQIISYLTKVKDYLLSSAGVLKYDDVVVPQDRLDIYNAEDITEVTDDAAPVVKVASQAAKLRKQNAQIVVHTLNVGYGDFTFSAQTVDTSDLFSLYPSNVRIVYCKSGQRDFVKELAHNLHERFKVGYNSNATTYTEPDHLKYFSTDVQPVAFIIIAQENLKYVKSSPRFISLKDFIFKSIDSTTGKLVFSDTLKTIMTVAAINSMIKIIPHLLRKLGEDAQEFTPKVATYMIPYTEYWLSHSNSPRSRSLQNDFMLNCMHVHLHQEQIVNNTNSVVDCNASIPDWLCEVIDFEITEVDSLFIDEIRKVLELEENYKSVQDLLQCFINGSSSYSVHTDTVKKNIKEYIVLKGYDAVL